MKIKALILAGVAALVCSTAFAQETNKDENGKRIYGPYETNKFWDNWFIDAGLGLNIDMDGAFESIKFHDNSKFKYGSGLDLNVAVGKWFTPCFGARLAWSGIRNGNIANNPHFGEFPGKIGYHYLHIDLLWNVSHQFAGYKELRRVNFIPYFTSGLIFSRESGSSKGVQTGYGVGAGLQVPIRCCDLIDFVPDVRYIGLTGESFGGKAMSGNFTATVGVRFNLPRRGWTRKATTVAKYTALVNDANAARDAAVAQKDQMAAEKDAALAKAADLEKENGELKKKLSEAEAKRYIDLAKNPAAVYFEIGQTTLSQKEQAHLKYHVNTLMKGNDDVQFILTGSADKFGATHKRNAALAKKRVEYVINFLEKECGLSKDRFNITTVVVDGSNPLARAVVITQ